MSEDKCILTPLNEDTRRVNARVLAKVPGEQMTHFSIDRLAEDETEENKKQYSVDYLNSIQIPGLPPHKLHLKTGCTVMLLRNISPQQGLSNGTRLTVE